jgi:hypothetical protein
VVGEEYVHEKECAQVKDNAEPENYHPGTLKEERQRKEKFPQQHQRHENRRVLANVR